MPLQDLTPQLRTRLSRVERAVGLFITTATLLLLAGFAYYIYHTAQTKGWFLTKVKYSTSLNNAIGLKAGNEVKLMGFSVGEITKVEANAPGAWYNTTIYFEIKDPYYGYLWTDSKVRIASADFLGNRFLEVIKGRDGIPTVLTDTNEVPLMVLNNDKLNKLTESTMKSLNETNKQAAAVLANLKTLSKSQPELVYEPIKTTNSFWLEPKETPAVTEQLESVVETVKNAIPSVLNLTNQLAALLSSTTEVSEKVDSVLDDIQPLLENLTTITGNITNPVGSLGDWLIPTNLNSSLIATLESADRTLERTDRTLASTDTNITALVTSIDETLINLANLTSNLNAQVQSNPDLVSNVSALIVDTDKMVQGLKTHWLLRSAFRTNKLAKPKPVPAKKFGK